MKSKFLSWNLKAIFVLFTLCAFLTGCYEKEEVDIPVVPDPIYVITGNLISSSTGAAVVGNILVNSQTVPTNENGSFKVNLTSPGTYTVSVNIAGYLPATRTVYLNEVSNGQVSSALVDIYLYPETTPVITPDSNNPATTTEATTVTETVKSDLINLIQQNPIAGTTVDNSQISTAVASDGSSTITIPVTINNPSSNTIIAKYYQTSGFSSTITPNYTRVTTGQQFITAIEEYLSMNYGLVFTENEQVLSVPEGYLINGYTIVINYTNRTFVVTIDGSPITGTISYQNNITITPVFESHDSHDSHDMHGGSVGAGGGASE